MYNFFANFAIVFIMYNVFNIKIFNFFIFKFFNFSKAVNFFNSLKTIYYEPIYSLF